MKRLNSEPQTLCWKIHGSAFQAAGIPDVVGLQRGIFFGIEVKVPGKKPTPIQALTLTRIRAAGGNAGCATSVAEALAILEEAPY